MNTKERLSGVDVVQGCFPGRGDSINSKRLFLGVLASEPAALQTSLLIDVVT